MSCELTEKISLLIDGELSPVETRAVERHLQTCAECQQARTDFMHLRREISAYTPALNAHAQQRALAALLGKQGRKATRATRATATTDTQRRPARIFGVPAFPFVVAALTTAAVALIVTTFAFFVVRQQNNPPQSASTQANNSREQVATTQTPAPTNDNDKVNTAGGGGEIVKGKEPAEQSPSQLEHQPANGETGRRVPAVVDAPRVPNKRLVSSGSTTARNTDISAPPDLHVPELLPPPRAANAPSYITINATAPTNAPVRPVDAGTLAARHVEQASLLLRAFRNARPDDEDAAGDLSYAKRRARQLFYQNIVLRREAASEGNVQLASLLDSLEPILIDIANLPDAPHADDLRAIRERIGRKNLVALLEVNSNALARAYE